MMQAVLILNSGCSVSALVTPHDFMAYDYTTTDKAVLKVEVSEVDFVSINEVMWQHRRNVYVVTPTTVHLVPEGEKYGVLHREELVLVET